MSIFFKGLILAICIVGFILGWSTYSEASECKLVIEDQNHALYTCNDETIELFAKVITVE
jgi:hypothetical protein